ncbi:hypothetical protein [Halorubrum cibi]|nr:hypothetical protein [Halorubrum cibi]
MYHPDLDEKGIRNPPYYYEAESYNDIPEKIESAVEACRKDTPDLSAVSELFSITHSTENLKSDLEAVFEELDESFCDEKFFFDNLDIRIARHHGMNTPNKNAFQCSFGAFLEQLRSMDEVEQVITTEDPEEDIAEELFDRSARGTEIDPSSIKLPTPASEQTPRMVSFLKSSGLYDPAQKIYRKSRIIQRVYKYLR